MNVIGLDRIRGDMDGAHPHRMRRGKVAGVVFEHCRAFCVDTIAAEDLFEGTAFGFRVKSACSTP